MTDDTKTKLSELADLLRQRSAIDRRISAIIERQVGVKNIGDFIAAEIFGLTRSDPTSVLNDASFTTGPHGTQRKYVSIRWYPHNHGVIDLVRGGTPSYYLVLTGPRAATVSTRALARPLSIHAIYFFDADALHETLTQRGARIAVGTVVDRDLWEQAEIYPRQISPLLTLTDEQRALIELFRYADLAL